MSAYFKFDADEPFGKPEPYLTEEGVTSLHVAVVTNQLHQVKHLIKCLKNQNISLDFQTKSGQTCLLLACKLDVDANIAKVLVAAGANVNISDNIKFTPLLAACMNLKLDIAEILVRAGASVNVQEASNDGRPHVTPLLYAVWFKNTKLVELLLDAGADVNIKDDDDENALIYSCYKFNEDTVERIVSLTTDLNTCNYEGKTALILAINTDNVELVSMLIKYGADVNFAPRDHEYHSYLPIYYAKIRSNIKIFQILWKHVNIEILNKEETSFYCNLIDWACDPDEPDKVKCFYEVINTPGVILCLGERYFYKLALNLTSNTIYQDDYQRELFGNESIDVCGITKLLLEKHAVFLDIDLEGLIYVCKEYHRCKYYERAITLLNLFIDNNIDISPHVIYVSVVNHPEFTLALLQYCIVCDPIDILKHFIKTKRIIDVSILNLIKNVLKLCSPSEELRFQCVLHIQTLSDYKKNPGRNCHESGELRVPAFFCVLESEIDYELCEEVLDLLLVNRVPSLLELSRDKIRQLLRVCCKDTSTFMQSINTLKLPKMLIDVIQCKVR